MTAHEINEARKRNHAAIDLVLQSQLQKTTIKRLVELCDKLRRPLMNTRLHHLYLEANEVLNDLEEREQI